MIKHYLLAILTLSLLGFQQQAVGQGTVPRYPAVIDCRTSLDPLCLNGMPPGVEPYSMEKAFSVAQQCKRGDDRSCFELCRRRLNGNSQTYRCPTLKNLNVEPTDLIITDNSFMCDTAALERKANALDHQNDESAFQKWIVSKKGACKMTKGEVSAKKISESEDEIFKVKVPSEGGRVRWVMSSFFKY